MNQPDETTGREDDIRQSIEDLDSSFDARRVEAREKLVSTGKSAVKYLIEAVDTNETTRQEAVRLLGKIGDASAIPVILKVIKDEDVDTRWLASEALIDMGPKSLVPLLEALIRNSDSAWFRDGASLVLHHFARQGMYEKLRPVLSVLGSSEANVEVPIKAEETIHNLSG